jgi:hypothetical protein
MKFLPWDPLQLPLKQSLGQRVLKPQVGFGLYRTYRKLLYWTPLLQDNAALFYGADASEFTTFLSALVEQATSFPHSVDVALYATSEHPGRGHWQELETTTAVFSHHLQEQTPLELLEGLVAYRTAILRELEGSGLLEPLHRRLLILVLHFTHDELRELWADPRGAQLLQSLFVSSRRARIYPLLATPHASSVPRALHERLEWSAALGTANEEWAKGFYADLEESFYSVRQKLIGVAQVKDTPRLTHLHPLVFEPSEWHVAYTEELAANDAAYEEFLATLDDGSPSHG